MAKKVSMKKFKARVKELREKAGVTAPLKAKKKEAPKKEASKKEEKKKEEAPKKKEGPFEEFKKKFAEEDMPEHIVKELYDHTQNAYSMLTKKSDLSDQDLVDFYGNFNDKLSAEDAEYIMQYLTQGESEKLCEFVDFADAMYSNLGRKEVFGYMFDMCTWYYSRAWIFSQCISIIFTLLTHKMQ